MAISRLIARNGHAGLARRIVALEEYTRTTSEQEAQERALRACWGNLPLLVRCYLASGDWDSDPRYSRLSRLVRVVLRVSFDQDMSSEARWQATAGEILRQTHHALTGKLMSEHGSNRWSYECAERQEAAELLFSVERIDDLDDAALLRAWAETCSERSAGVARCNSCGDASSVDVLDVLEPAALAVLNAAAVSLTDQPTNIDTEQCPHVEEHLVPPGLVRVALESALFYG